MMVEDLKVTWGIGRGLGLGVYIRILSWTGIFLSAIIPLIGLGLLIVLSASQIMTLQILFGEVTSGLALTSFAIVTKNIMTPAEDDKNKRITIICVSAAVLILGSLIWCFFNMVLRKVWMALLTINNLTDFNFIEILENQSRRLDWCARLSSEECDSASHRLKHHQHCECCSPNS